MVKTYLWNGPSNGAGTFQFASSWIDESTGTTSTSVPGAGDTVDFSGMGFVLGTGTVAVMNVTATSSGFTLANASLSATDVFLSGSLAIAYDSTLLADTLTVAGGAAPGVLFVNGGTLTHLDAGLDLTVSGTSQNGTSANLYVVDANGGSPSTLLDVGNGSLQIGNGASQSGSLLLGSGATISGAAESVLAIGTNGGQGFASVNGTIATAGSITIGDVGIGQLNLQNATVSAGNGKEAALIMGGAPVGITQSFASLSSTFSQLTLDGQAQIGLAGPAQLFIGGGTLTTEAGVSLGVSQTAHGTLSLSSGAAWTDTGNIIVGQAGYGSLSITGAATPVPAIATDVIHGDIMLGTSGGTGTLMLNTARLQVFGETLFGTSTTNVVAVQQGGVFDAAGEVINLQADNSPNILSVSGSLSGAASTLDAGQLLIGTNADAGFGYGAQGTIGTSAGAIAIDMQGALTVYEASLSVTGAVDISGDAGAHGLQVTYGTVSINAGTTSLAISQGGHASVGLSATLNATGGIAIAGASSTLEIDSLGTVTATAAAFPGAAALALSSGATLSLGGGTLTTHGLFFVGDARLASNTAGGLVTVTGGSLSSTAAASAPAVDVGSGGSGSEVDLSSDSWSVTGAVDVGTAGNGRLLLERGGSIGINGTLAIGSSSGTGVVTTYSSAAVDITGDAAIPTAFNGIAAASLDVTGAGSSLSTGTLTIGAAGAPADATISRGSVSVGTDATINGLLTLRVAGSLSAGGTITLDQGARIFGQGILQSAAIVDDGRIQVKSGTMRCLGPVSGDGLLEVSHAHLALRYGSAATVALAFGGFGTVTVTTVNAIAGTIRDWGIGDAIRFTQSDAVTETFADHTLSLFNAGGRLLGTETFAGTLTARNFSLTADLKGALLTYHS